MFSEVENTQKTEELNMWTVEKLEKLGLTEEEAEIFIEAWG